MECKRWRRGRESKGGEERALVNYERIQGGKN